MRHELVFPLKGERNYVQGTSLFNGIVDAASAAGFTTGQMNISFRHIIENTLCIVQRRRPQAFDAVTAELKAVDGAQLQLCINPADKPGTVYREKYDEARICRNSIVGNRSIALDNARHENSIELVVALCKKMHCELIDSSKKWIFSRYVGIFPLPSIRHIEIVNVKQVGTRLTCNEVIISGKKIGELFFSS